MKNFIKVLIGILSAIICYFVLRSFIASGWKGVAAEKVLTVFGTAAGILTVTVIIMALILTSMREEIRQLRLSGNAEYIRHVASLEDRYYDLLDENKQLQRNIAQVEARADMSDYYLEKFTSKPTFSDAVMINKENGKFTSLDGMTKKEKEREAYRMSCEGMSREDIASALGVAVGSVGVYISKGRKSYETDGGDPERHGNEIRFRMPHSRADRNENDTDNAVLTG